MLSIADVACPTSVVEVGKGYSKDPALIDQGRVVDKRSSIVGVDDDTAKRWGGFNTFATLKWIQTR